MSEALDFGNARPVAWSHALYVDEHVPTEARDPR